ncbi:MAG: hypothetical protein ACXWPM_09800, partial [Bdellovibrionota bacterium]
MSSIGFKIAVVFGILGGLAASDARALELDWSGNFRAEFNWLHDYNFDASDAGVTTDPTRAAANGYYIRGGGSHEALFQTLSLRLRPKLIVNDNIYIKSEWWLGDPVYGLFGNAWPSSMDQNQYYSNQSRGSAITAARVWAEFLTDIGTVQVGRAPLDWGLGAVWRAGDDVWDRYESTADLIRMNAKFGAFSFAPAFILRSLGSSVGGNVTVTGPSNYPNYTVVPSLGSGALTDYAFTFKYENTDQQLEGGLNIIKTIAIGSPNVQVPAGPTPVTTGTVNYVTYDIYGKKIFLNKISLAAEAPISTGNLGPQPYTSFAVLTEFNYKISEMWETGLKAGYVPGQPNFSGTQINTFNEFFINPGYKLGLIMFNFAPQWFAGPNTTNDPRIAPNQLVSPYDNPITNAIYVAPGAAWHLDKWSVYSKLITGWAPNTAASGLGFFNPWNKTTATAFKDQSSNWLGFEGDIGGSFKWDEYFLFKLDFGIMIPGGFYAFSNTAVDNAL